MKKVLSVVLALVMILSTASVSIVSAETIVPDGTMTVGETRTVYLINGDDIGYDDYVVIKFVPQGSGLVAISSESSVLSDSDPVLEIWNEERTVCLAKNDDFATDKDFYCEFECKAGEVYYLMMSNSEEATSWKVSIECFHEEYRNGACATCLKKCDHKVLNNLVKCCPCGEKFTGMEIKEGDTIDMFSSKDYFWLKFEPTETAVCLLSSDNTDDPETDEKAADPAIVIVDATGNKIIALADDISKDDENFAIPYEFELNERYFIGIYDNNENSDNWTFTLKEITTHAVEVTGEDGTVTTENHDLIYVDEVPATHTEGHSAGLYCEECNEYIFGGEKKDAISEKCIDKNSDDICDVCGESTLEPVEEDCSCSCHSDNPIIQAIWNFIISICKPFRLWSVCSCGERHYAA